MKRIGFTGASGTGKTTLASYISERFNLPMNPIGARTIAKEMGFDSPYDVDKAGKRFEFQVRLVKAKCEWEAAHDEFVTDRTTIDNLVYTMLHDVHAIDDDLVRLIVKGMSRYTTIIHCPITSFCHLGDDPARVKDATYQRLYEVTLLGAMHLATHPFEFHVLHEKDLAERKADVYYWARK